MLKRKKKFDPPVRVWVVFDVESGHPTMAFQKSSEAEPFDGEIVYEYTLNPRKK